MEGRHMKVTDSHTTTMKPLKLTIKILKLSLAAVFTATLLLQTLASTVASSYILRLINAAPALFISATATFLYFLSTRRHRPVYLLNYSCFKPIDDRKCTYEDAERFVQRTGRFSSESEEFMRRIYLKSGLGNETYGPAFVFDSSASTEEGRATLESAREEAREGIFAAVDSLLEKTKIDPAQIDMVIATCGCFSLAPSLSAEIVNRYKMRDDVKSYNLSGMGCSSGVISIDTAAQLLRQQKQTRYALVLITENISLNWSDIFSYKKVIFKERI